MSWTSGLERSAALVPRTGHHGQLPAARAGAEAAGSFNDPLNANARRCLTDRYVTVLRSALSG
jgi:hypothetical protein